MTVGKRTVNRRAVLEQMMALAAGAANDVVKLAYLTQEQTQEIDTLDLGCLTEFKRNSSGAVEVKLTDRRRYWKSCWSSCRTRRTGARRPF